MLIEQVPVFFRGFFHPVLWRESKKEKSIYLTFDDGPIPEVTPWVLDQLDALDIKATFFCIGNNVEKNPDIFEEIKKRGHQVGSHGYSHIRGMYKNTESFFADIEKADTLIKSHLFRPPHGHITPVQIRALKKYKIVLWDVITRDYNPNLAPEKILVIAKKYTRNGSIIVFHDSLKAQENMRYAFPLAVKYFQEQGFVFKTL